MPHLPDYRIRQKRQNIRDLGMARLASSLKDFLDRPDAERRLGPFVLIEQLGRGGFAPVWLAKEVYGATELRTAALKLFSLDAHELRGAGPDSDGARRIVEEARALCQVEHPNVVRFYALPIDETLGIMGLAMEHVAGTSLDQRLLGSGRLSVADTLAVGTAIASALAAVHGAGLVHRDVKPSNVVESGGVFKLIDFGIAAADDFTTAPPTQAASGDWILDDLPPEAVGSKMSSMDLSAPGGGSDDTAKLAIRCGTVGYIDPVCVSKGETATPASDLYALGVTLFECLTGKLPASCGAPRGAGLHGEVLDGRAAPPSILTMAPEIPAELGKLIDALLAPKRSRRPTSAEWVAIRLEQIRTDLAGHKRALPPEAVGPFRGLGRFEEGDRDVYFGRTSEVAAALEMLRGRGLVALLGPSGSGKSSLARAGVLPAVANGALAGWPKRWDSVIVAPGHDSRAAITVALTPFVPQAADASPAALVVLLAERVQESGWGLILLIDQLEELATMDEEASRAWTAELLARLSDQALPGLRALVAIRRDLLDPLLAMTELGRALVRGSVLIEPLREVVWRDVLEQALGAYGYALEDDELRDELLGQLDGTAGAMPLVQFALTELWHKRDVGKKRVTRAGLRALGGIAGALERHADATLAKLVRTHPGQEDAARRVLLALTTPQGTRTEQSVDQLSSIAGDSCDAVISAFEEARLVVRGAEGVTLAHEALLTQWGRLRAWVAEAREDRLLADELERDAASWSADPESAPLWQRRRLSYGEDLGARAPLSPTAIAFLQASRRAARRGRLVLGGSAAIALASLSIAGFLYIWSQEQRTRDVEAQQAQIEDKQREIAGKQARIEELLRSNEDLATDSEGYREALALQEELRKELPAEAPRSALTAEPAAPVALRQPAAAQPLSPPAIMATQTAAATAKTIKVKRDW